MLSIDAAQKQRSYIKEKSLAMIEMPAKDSEESIPITNYKDPTERNQVGKRY